MSDHSRHFLALRKQAAAHLPPDFARRVMRESDRLRRRRAAQTRIIAMTGILCAVLAIAIHAAGVAALDRQNLEMWAKTAAQARALEVSL